MLHVVFFPFLGVKGCVGHSSQAPLRAPTASGSRPGFVPLSRDVPRSSLAIEDEAVDADGVLAATLLCNSLVDLVIGQGHTARSGPGLCAGDIAKLQEWKTTMAIGIGDQQVPVHATCCHVPRCALVNACFCFHSQVRSEEKEKNGETVW